MDASEDRLLGVRHFDVTITNKNLDSSVKTLIGHIKKSWDVEKLQKKVFDNGITNKLIGYYVSHGGTRMTSQFGEYGRSEMVLFRIYGNKTELFIDRAKELRNFQLLASNDLAAPLYCTFENGYCYGFIEGKVLEPPDMSDAVTSKLCAKIMARMHSIKLPESYKVHIKPDMDLYGGLQKMLKVAPRKFSDADKQKK